MSIIYQPRGRAAEYASWALNVYRGCDHGCTYCYAPLALKMKREAFEAAQERPNYFHQLMRDARKYAGEIDSRILLSFTCDPYQQIDAVMGHTRRTIQILREHGLVFQTLTKGGSRALRDLDLFTPSDAFATTLTLLSPEHSATWEPGAASPQERMDTLRIFHDAGIPTWVSLEPVINPESTLKIIEMTADFVDLYKVGTINYQRSVIDGIDWHDFGTRAISLLEDLEKDYFIKDDLKKHL